MTRASTMQTYWDNDRDHPIGADDAGQMWITMLDIPITLPSPAVARRWGDPVASVNVVCQSGRGKMLLLKAFSAG
jgi:hypothetical protein